MKPMIDSAAAPPRRAGDAVRLGAVAVFGLVLAAGVGYGTQVPSHVPRVIIENPHEYDITVEITDLRRTGVVLGVAEHGQRTAFGEVLDQGEVWLARFSYAGVRAGEVRLARVELREVGFRIRVPDGAAERLRTAGFRPTE